MWFSTRYDLNRSAQQKAIYLVFFCSNKEAAGSMVSHNKEADQTVKVQYFSAGKILTGFPSNGNT